MNTRKNSEEMNVRPIKKIIGSQSEEEARRKEARKGEKESRGSD